MSSQLPPSLTDQEVLALITAIEQIRICNYVTVSATAFMLYDIIINLDKGVLLYPEYRGDVHGVRRRRVIMQFLFIFGRYYGVVFTAVVFSVNNTTGHSVAFCKGYYYYLILAGEVLYTTVVNVILVTRIEALCRTYHRDSWLTPTRCRAILRFLLIVDFVVEFTICTIMALHTESTVVSPPQGVPWPGCMTRTQITPALTLASWITALVVSTIFCGITLVLAFSAKEWNWRVLRNHQPMLQSFVRDGIVFYFLIFTILLVSTIIIILIQNELSDLPLSILVAVYSYCASRLILNVRDRYRHVHFRAPTQENVEMELQLIGRSRDAAGADNSRHCPNETAELEQRDTQGEEREDTHISIRA